MKSEYYANGKGRLSDLVYRSCSRCRKELTDPASREHGQGPCCRRKNNTIFSRQMPANLNVATALFLSLKPESFYEEISGEFGKIRKKYLYQMEKAQKANEDLTAVRVRGGDYREVIDWFDRSLSFPCSESHRENITKIIEALGYIGLASILRGDACMSSAHLYVEGENIILRGKSQKRGWFAMRRNVPEIRLPRFRGGLQPYSTSVRNAEKFIEIAVRHWPFIEEDVDKVLKEAQKIAKKLPESKPKETDNGPDVAYISEVSGDGWFTTKTSWLGTRAEMYAMLDKFKEVPGDERRFDKPTFTWFFKENHLDFIKNIVAERYQIVKVKAPNVATKKDKIPKFKADLSISRKKSNWFEIRFPWLNDRRPEMFALIASLKEIQYRDRHYNVSAKVWSFKNEHLEHVRKSLSKNSLFKVVIGDKLQEIIGFNKS